MSFEMIGDVDMIGDDDLSALLGDDDDDDDDGGGDDFLGAAGFARSARGLGGGGVQQLAKAKRIVKQARYKAAGKLAAQKLARTGMVIRPKQYTSYRNLPAGFRSLAVAAGATVNVTVRAPVPIKPRRLIIPAPIAPNFTLDRVTVGLDNHLITADSIPCDLFVPGTTAIDEDGTGFWKIPTLDTGTEIVMSFTNISGAAADLRGAWLCAAAVSSG